MRAVIHLSEWQDYHGFRDRIAEVVDTRFYTLEWLDAEIWSGRARVWMSGDSCIIATLKVYPAGAKEVHGLVAVGDAGVIRALIRHAEIWGREHGCTVAGIDSRAGWGRVLKEDGYSHYQTCLRKELV